MKKQRKIVILALTAAIIVGVVAAYLFTIGPLGKPVLASVNGEKITVASFAPSCRRSAKVMRESWRC